LAYYKNIPIASSKNIPLALLAQCDGGFVGGYKRSRRYTRAEQIEKLAVDKYSKDAEFINKVNKWELFSPIIRNNVYVEEGTSRKQALNKMDESGLDTIPVVSIDERYVGVTEKDTIIYGIVKDLYAKYVQS
jgi:signal-transduction protein with cAMP-binding, CBS, and nucleotidyltransferase domain